MSSCRRVSLVANQNIVRVAGLTRSGTSTVKVLSLATSIFVDIRHAQFISRAIGEDVGIGPNAAGRLNEAVGSDQAVDQDEAVDQEEVVEPNEEGGADSMPSWTSDVKLFRTPNDKLVLADTPGFNNTRKDLGDAIIQGKITTLVQEYVVVRSSCPFLTTHQLISQGAHIWLHFSSPLGQPIRTPCSLEGDRWVSRWLQAGIYDQCRRRDMGRKADRLAERYGRLEEAAESNPDQYSWSRHSR